jgi:acetyl esterase/lipase
MNKRAAIKTTFYEKLKAFLTMTMCILMTLLSLFKPKSHLNLLQRTNQLLLKYMANYSSHKSSRYLFGILNYLQKKINNVEIVTSPFGDWIGKKDGQDGYVLVYFHGGGYCIGNSTQSLEACIDWLKSEKVDCVFSVDYPLAPDSVFPEQVEFCKSAVVWLCDQGIAMDRMIFIGDSAGGHSVITTLLSIVKDIPLSTIKYTSDIAQPPKIMTRNSSRLSHLAKNRINSPSRNSTETINQSEPHALPKGAVLISPWVDPTSHENELMEFYHDEDLLTPSTLVGFREVMFPDSTSWTNDFVNLFMIDDQTLFKIFSQVPVMITFGGIELLSNQAVRFGNNVNRVLEKEKSPLRVTFDVDPDMPHVYQAFGAMHFGKNATMGNARIIEWIDKL